MANRRGSTSNFNSTFSRRPATSISGPLMSILGDPPVRRQSQSFGSYGGGSGQTRQGNSGHNSSGRRGEDEDHYHDYGHGDSLQGRQGGGSYQNVSFITQGSRQREHDFTRSQAQEISPWSTTANRRSPSPTRRHASFNRGSSPHDDDRRRNTSNTWSTGRGFEESLNPFKSGQGGGSSLSSLMQNSGLQSMTMSGLGQNVSDRQGNQPLVMVVPQGQAGAGGIMGMMPLAQGSQNPFNVLQRQGPMQVILGNLPAFNSDAFGQQLLTAATNAQFGQAMGGTPMRLMGGQGQQRQGSNQFNRQAFNRDTSDRSRISRPRNSQGAGTPSGRRPGPDSNRNLVLRNGRGSNSNTPNASQRGRKRGYSDRQVANEVEKKKLRQSQTGKPNNNKDKGGKTTNTTPGKTPQAKQNKKKSDGPTPKAGDTPAKENLAKEKVGESTTEEKVDAENEKVKADEKEAETLEEKADGEEEEQAEVKIVEEKQKKKNKYDEIPVELFVCKICQKTMNDAGSFESHLNGRAHHALAKILDQRFKKRADVLMSDSKLNEDEILIEIERQRRAGKHIQSVNKNKNFCKMCDCNYAVNWGTHKLSLGHRVLKEFLHPVCRICETHFVQRLEWVKHLTDVIHLRKLVELREEGKDLVEESSTIQDQLFSVNLEMSKDEHVSNCITIRNANWKIPSKEDLKEILDSVTQDLIGPDEEIIIPKKYDETVSYGTNAINDVNGFSCKICRTYIATEKEVEIHCKSKAHFGAYSGFLRKLAKHREQLKEEEQQAEADRVAAEAKEKEKSEEVETVEEVEEVEETVETVETVETKVENATEEETDIVELNGTNEDETEYVEEENVPESANDTLEEEDMEVIDEVQGDDAIEDMDGDYNVVEDEVGGDDDDIEILDTPSDDVIVVNDSPKERETSPTRVTTPKSGAASVKATPEKAEAKPKEVQAKPKEAETKPKEAEAKPKEVETKSKEAEAKPKEVDTKSKQVDTKSKEVETKSKEAVAKPKEVDTKSNEAEAKSKEAEAKSKEAEAKLKEVETKSKEPVAKPKEVETKSNEAEAKPKEAAAKPKEVETKSKEAEAKPKETDAKSKEVKQVQPAPEDEKKVPAFDSGSPSRPRARCSGRGGRPTGGPPVRGNMQQNNSNQQQRGARGGVRGNMQGGGPSRRGTGGWERARARGRPYSR